MFIINAVDFQLIIFSYVYHLKNGTSSAQIVSKFRNKFTNINTNDDNIDNRNTDNITNTKQQER